MRVRQSTWDERFAMRSKHCISLRGVFGVWGATLLLLSPLAARAQTVVGTVPTPGSRAVAVNTVSNKIYVAGADVTVIDGASNSTTAVGGGGYGTIALAVNPVTNKIYVANTGAGGGLGKPGHPSSITVIDGATNATVQIKGGGVAVAVNPATNKIYVASSQVIVIDGATNSATTISDPNATASGLFPVAIAVNTTTNKIYVANNNGGGSTTSNPGTVTVIDGLTNSTTTITDQNAVYPVSIAVNATTNKIYVVNKGDYPGSNHGNVTVIDGVTNTITTVTDPNALMPLAVAVNQTTNKIYVANANDPALTGNGSVTVIDGATNSVSTIKDPNAIYPHAVAVNSATNTIYVANGGCILLGGCSEPGSVTVINGASNSTTTVVDPNANTPNAVAVNETTDKAYVANFLSDNTTVIDASAAPTSYTLSVLLAGSGGGTITSNPAGINCETSCSLSFATGTDLMLTASPASGSEFSGWSGACTGIGSCNVTMNAAKLVKAAFNIPDFYLQPASLDLTAQRGSQVTDAVTIAPLSGTSFGDAIQLSCAVTAVQLPSIVTWPIPTCALSPSSVTPGAGSVTSMLTITAPTSSAGLIPPEGQLSGPLYAVFLPIPLALIGFGLASRKSKQGRHGLCLLCSLFIAFVGLQAGCGGGTSSNRLTPPPPIYAVTVTATSGAIQHTTQVNVTVP